MGRSHVSLVLRLLSASATEGELVGAAEVVATGESVTIRSAADLVALASRLAGAEAGPEGREAGP